MFERSFHFIPCDKPERFDGVAKLGADAYIFDLEDAVAEPDKQQALSSIQEWLTAQELHANCFIRINGVEHPIAEQERYLINNFPQVGVVLPKVQSLNDFKLQLSFYRIQDSHPVIALIESAAILRCVPEILGTGRLTAIGLGLQDFLSHSIFDPEQLRDFVQHVRSGVALQAMAAGIPAIDSISTDVQAGADLQRHIEDARSAGMTAKFSIDPRQIDPINRGFSPTEEVISQAQKILKICEEEEGHGGNIEWEDLIITPPNQRKSAKVVAVAKHYGLEESESPV